MHIKKSTPLLSQPLEYFYHSGNICTIIPIKHGAQFIAFDAESSNPLGAFQIIERVLQASHILENDILYIITSDGIIGYDSFTGDKVIIFDSGSLLPLRIYSFNNCLYAICGIPIVSGTSINTQNVCIACFNKETGKRMYQTQNMSIDFFDMVATENDMWIASGNYLYQYDFQCDLLSSSRLVSYPGYPPILTENYVIVASEFGTLEIFTKNNKPYRKMLIDTNSSIPVYYDNDCIIWITGKLMNLIDVKLGKCNTLKSLDNNVESSPCVVDGIIYVSDNAGNLISYSIYNDVINTISIDKSAAWKPVVSDNKDIYIACNNILYQIGA